MSVTNERLVLSSLVKNTTFSSKTLPFIKPEYFGDDGEKLVFSLINEYTAKYNDLPNKSVLHVNLQNSPKIGESQLEACVEIVNDIFDIIPPENTEWLVETTEKWCRDRAIYNAINESILIYQKENKKVTEDAIPDILRNAISVAFDSSIGLDYDDVDARWEMYVSPEFRIPFRMSSFNDVTCKGVFRKTLNVLVAGVNVGKTASLCSLAADYIKDGLNVLYFSLEMSESEITKRIDANMLNVKIGDIQNLGKEKFMSRISAIREKANGKLVVKQLPTGAAGVTHFRNILNDLKTKKQMIPDIIMVDYIQITASSLMTPSAGSYFYYKSVAEELRALAIERDCVVWTAAQFNRGGMTSSDAAMTDIAESVGIAATADGMWGLFRTEELDAVSQLLVKQLKSRYANKAVKEKFVIGVDIEKAMLFDVEDDEMKAEVIGGSGRKPTSTIDKGERFDDMVF